MDGFVAMRSLLITLRVSISSLFGHFHVNVICCLFFKSCSFASRKVVLAWFNGSVYLSGIALSGASAYSHSSGCVCLCCWCSGSLGSCSFSSFVMPCAFVFVFFIKFAYWSRRFYEVFPKYAYPFSFQIFNVSFMIPILFPFSFLGHFAD